MALLAAGWLPHNPNAPWWENLLVQVVVFGVLALAMDLVRRFGPTQKPSVGGDEQTRQPAGEPELPETKPAMPASVTLDPRQEMRPMAQSAISGIDGWLLLPALGLIAAPFLTAFSVYLNLIRLGDRLPAEFQVALMMETLLLSGMVLFQA
jgi:hypothetical protein